MTTSEISFDNIPPFTGNFSSVSASDLDEMFDKNLKLLNDFENHDLSSNSNNKSAQRYQSSLNIYISPQKNWRHSAGVYFSCYDVRPLNQSQCDTFKMSENSVVENTSCQLTKSSLYSSYETLYDDLKLSKKNKEKTFETMSQSLLNTSTCSINQYLNSNRKQSSESDGTLKSLSSRDSSSSVSSIDSQMELKKNQVKHFQTSVMNCKNFHESTSDIPKLRTHVDSNSNIRPNSCYVDVKFGQYLTKPNKVFIRKPNSNDQSNIVISKPLGNYPNRSMNNYLSIITNNKSNNNNNFRVPPSRSDQLSYNSSSKQLFPTKNKQNLSSNNHDVMSSNILNNHFMENNNNFQSISSIPCNNIPPNISQSWNQLEHVNNHLNIDTDHSYNSNINSKSDLKKQLKPITIDQSRKPTNNIITNLQRSNQNFTMQPIKNASENKTPSNEKIFISKSKSHQIERTNGKI